MNNNYVIMDCEKKYEEALERAKKWRNAPNVDKIPTFANRVIEEIFPELCESEDERISKKIKKILNWYRKSFSEKSLRNEEYDEMFAWLEKQGKQKPIDKIQLGKKYKCIASPRYSTFRRGETYKPEDNFLCNLMNLCYECFEPIEDGEQKPAWSEEELTDFEKSLKHVMEETLECGDMRNLKADADLLLRLAKPTDEDMKETLRTEYEKGRADAFAQMQKEWSEEDEVKINRIVACLENLNVADNDILLKDVDWLKSIKDRVQPQPKREWSEEDEKTWKELIEEVKDQLDSVPSPDCRDKEDEKALKQLTRWLVWLKSLKERYTWKPSDKQMEALKQAKTDACGKPYFNALASLYVDLQ